MPYKVFLVEDEVITREGIRDNVDWASVDYEFCGEASDGEAALPEIEAIQPDVLITDIKMPFMDGLQLSRIVRERMPWIRIIILSGHDEFEYAQSALKLGVTEYLLKPISSQDLSNALKNLSEALDQETRERKQMKLLYDNVEENLGMAREKFLLRLVMGGVSSVEALEKSQSLGLDLVARYYQVALIRIELCDESQPFDYQEYKQVEQIASSLAGGNGDVFLAGKDMEELVVLFKGNSLEQLEQNSNFFTRLIKTEVESQTSCGLIIAMGNPQNRLGDIHHSFTEALVKIKSQIDEQQIARTDEALNLGDLAVMDHQTIEDYLKFGSIAEFDQFFTASIQPIAVSALRSYLVKHYMFLDILMTTTQFISDLGGEQDQLFLDIHEVEGKLSGINSLGQIKEEVGRIMIPALKFRNSCPNHERGIIIQQAKAYIDNRFWDPDLQRNEVAGRFNISPSYFSTVFKQEVGISFREYLSKIRINRAKDLLRTTNIKCSEVAYQSGYNDPHYFSSNFKNKTGLTPQQFREQSQDNQKVE